MVVVLVASMLYWGFPSIKSLCHAISHHLDRQDIAFYLGLLSLGYGLRLYKPWLSYTVCGALLIAISLAPSFMGRRISR